MDTDIIVLTDEDGFEVSYEILDVLTHQGEEYAVLFPVEADEDEPVHIYRITSEDLDTEEMELEGLDDDRLLQDLYKMFLERNDLE